MKTGKSVGSRTVLRWKGSVNKKNTTMDLLENRIKEIVRETLNEAFGPNRNYYYNVFSNITSLARRMNIQYDNKSKPESGYYKIIVPNNAKFYEEIRRMYPKGKSPVIVMDYDKTMDIIVKIGM